MSTFSRRQFFALAAAGRIYRAELEKYADPATELPVFRMTDPSFASGLTAPHLKQFAKKGEALLCWSDRSGTRQAYVADLRTGESRQMTEAGALDPVSLTYSGDEKSFYFFDGSTLNEGNIANGRIRSLYQIPAGTSRIGISVASDGSILFIEVAGSQGRVIRWLKQRATLVREAGDLDLVVPRPRLGQLAFRSGKQWWLANLDGSGARQLRLKAGNNESVIWTASGRSMIYLHIPEDARELIALREHVPEDDSDRELARTSQFAAVSANGDASVFAGASRGKASAYVLLLLRVTRRELTLCEHRASDPSMVSPIFSPDSQSVFFVSDRHGKSAIYRIHVEKFVESTSDDGRPD